MLWDGESRGTLANVENLATAGKPVSVYVGPRRRFVNVRSPSDFGALLNGREPGPSAQQTSADLQTAFALPADGGIEAGARAGTSSEPR